MSETSKVSQREHGTSPDIKVVALTELREGEANGSALVVQMNPLHQVKTRLQVCVGELEITIGELLAARENQLLTLNRSIDHPIDLMLDGKVVARGELVAVGEFFGVRITDIPVSLKL